MRAASCFIGAWLAVSGLGLAKEKVDDRQILDPVVVHAPPPPLIKLHVNFHLRTPRFGTAAVVDGDYVYIVAGANSQGQPLDDIERFNLRTGISEPFAKLKLARRNHRAVIHAGKIYVLGGYGGTPFAETDIFENSMEIVDIATGAVTKGPRMPQAKANFACAIAGGKIYVIGGAKIRGSNLATTNSVETYDMAKGKWEKSLTMPTPRMSSAVNVEDFIIVPGGYSNHRELDTVEVFNPREQVWRKLPPLNQHLSANSVVFLDHYLFLFGEHELVAYELREKKSASYRFEYTAAGDTASIIHEGKVYVFGGRAYAGPTLDEYFSQDGGSRTPTLHLGPGEAPMKNPFVLKAPESSLKDMQGISDYGAMDEIQVFALRDVMNRPKGTN